MAGLMEGVGMYPVFFARKRKLTKNFHQKEGGRQKKGLICYFPQGPFLNFVQHLWYEEFCETFKQEIFSFSFFA